VVLGGLDEVARVSDAGPIPQGIPLLHLPDLGLLSFDLVVGAFAVAVIVLVQGAGVSESVPNPDGMPSNMNRDFMAQGAANLVSGLFRGMPVGGSAGQTALNVSVGARTRWAAIWSGVWMLVILVVFSGVVGLVAMPTLAAILVFAAVGSLRPREIRNVLRTGRIAQVAVVTTFLATLFLPVAMAVGIGVAQSLLLLQLNQEAMDLTVVELVPQDDGRFVERPAPGALTNNRVTVLDVYGSLFYTDARTLQAKLPDPTGTVVPVLVLRLRGRSTLGATFAAVTADYAKRLDAVGGRLYLSGLDPDLTDVSNAAGRSRSPDRSRSSRPPNWSASPPRRPTATPRPGSSPTPRHRTGTRTNTTADAKTDPFDVTGAASSGTGEDRAPAQAGFWRTYRHDRD
jgi:sulfate permease, SulP family